MLIAFLQQEVANKEPIIFINFFKPIKVDYSYIPITKSELFSNFYHPSLT